MNKIVFNYVRGRNGMWQFRKKSFGALGQIARLFVLASFFVLVVAPESAQTAVDEFDLSEHLTYEPKQRVSGTVRSWGNDMMADVLRAWEVGFSKYHPDVVFEDNMVTTAIAIPAITIGVADLGFMGREVFPIELIAYRKVHNAPPLTLAVSGGTLDVEGKTWSLAIYVHEDNPLTHLTMKQLDGIFGAERTGGWNESKIAWQTAAARGPEQNIRTWGELGLKGAWANQSIRTYGFDLIGSGFSLFFSDRVFEGSDKWNENLREFVGMRLSDGSYLASPSQMTAALSKDRYGIGYAGLQHAVPQLKTLKIAAKDSKHSVELSRQTAQDRSYPLARLTYVHVKRDPGEKLEPRIEEFLRYILSREGQQAVTAESDFLPLPASKSRSELTKLD